jgi:hypothetical protein
MRPVNCCQESAGLLKLQSSSPRFISVLEFPTRRFENQKVVPRDHPNALIIGLSFLDSNLFVSQLAVIIIFLVESVAPCWETRGVERTRINLRKFIRRASFSGVGSHAWGGAARAASAKVLTTPFRSRERLRNGPLPHRRRYSR